MPKEIITVPVLSEAMEFAPFPYPHLRPGDVLPAEFDLEIDCAAYLSGPNADATD